MTAGNEKGAKKLEWEPPRLMRLTAPGDAAAVCGGPGSGQVGDCNRNGSTANTCFLAGPEAFAVCADGAGPA